MTDPMELVGRLEGGSDRFLKWAYKEPYSGAPVISIPRHPDNIDSLLTEAAACIREMVEWRPIETAPKDRTPILARVHDDLFPRIVGEARDDLELWNGQRVVVHHPGLCEDGFDLGWSVSAPVGTGIGRDDWFSGWLPLPPAPGAEDE